MIVLNVFQMVLFFYPFLHSFTHLAAKESLEDEDSFSDYPDVDETVFYHIKEAATAAAKYIPIKRRQSIFPRKTAPLTRARTSPITEGDVAKKTRKRSEIYFTIKTPQWLSITSILSTETMNTTTSTSTPVDYTETDKDSLETRGSKEIFPYDPSQKNYTNFSVLLITPASIEQLNEILEFEYKDQDYNFWSHRRVSDAPLTVLLPPSDISLRTILRKHKIDYTILIENLQTVLDYERGKSIKQISPSLTGISFNMYLRYAFVMDFLTHLSLKYPETTRLITIGKTVEDRDIRVIEIKDPNPPEKTIGAVLIQAGMHGREWLGVSAALYAINQLVEHASANKDMFDGIFWYILPIFNADGYEYSHTSDRLWKNNRKQYGNCTGVDLDRNFEAGNVLEHKLPGMHNCTNLYAGDKPGSEPETLALKRFLIATKTVVKVYVSLHSGDPFIAYPWAYKSERSADYEQMVELATTIKKAIEASDNSTNFFVDSLHSLCGIYDGAAVDWAKQEGVLYPLMLSLKGGVVQGFDVPSENIFDAVVAAFNGIQAIANHLHIPENMSINEDQKDLFSVSNSSTVRFFVIGILVWLTISCVI